MAGMIKPPEDLTQKFVEKLDELERAIFRFDVDEVYEIKTELVRLYDDLRKALGAMCELRNEWEDSMSRLRSMKDDAEDRRYD